MKFKRQRSTIKTAVNAAAEHWKGVNVEHGSEPCASTEPHSGDKQIEFSSNFVEKGWKALKRKIKNN